MKIIPIYLVLFSFWLINIMKFRLSEVRGLSLMNVCFYLLIIIWGLKSLKKRQFFEPNNLNKSIIIMICVALTSVLIKIQQGEFTNLNLWEEILDVKNWADPFFVFFAIFNIIENEKQCKQGILGLVFLVIISVIPTLFVAFGIMNFEIIEEKQRGRAAGFAEANQYATFLVLFLPILLSHFLFKKNIQIKIFWLICLLLAILSLVLTGSRGGTIAFMFSMLAYLWFIKSFKIVKMFAIMRIAGTLVLFCVAAYLVSPTQLKELSAKRFNPQNYQNIEEFSNTRIPGLRKGFVLFLENPILGHGHGTYIPLVKKRQFINVDNSHNDYLLFLVHYGLIGLIIYIAILTKIFKQLWQAIKVTKILWNKIFYMSYLAGFLGYAISMFGVNLFHVRIIFWCYTAIIYKYSQIELNKR